jgi:hypothetical protein
MSVSKASVRNEFVVDPYAGRFMASAPVSLCGTLCSLDGLFLRAVSNRIGGIADRNFPQFTNGSNQEEKSRRGLPVLCEASIVNRSRTSMLR